MAFCADCGAGMNYKNDRHSYVCSTYQKNGSKKCSSHIIKFKALINCRMSRRSNLNSRLQYSTSHRIFPYKSMLCKIVGVVLKQVVLANLKELIDNSLNMQSLVDVTIQRAGIKKNNAVKELDKVQREITKLDKELVQLTRKWTSGDIDKEMFNACCGRSGMNAKH
ncbi:zinc ribbon domain-containing protein [Paenibacillus chitinolyticus]|uniref:zinc ribbon domain-containing protein n=1 Tax=Paenibacillus chitinolyticus TaxID=79263 RepID=UPI003D0815C8